MRHTDTHAVKNERRGRTGTRSKEQRVRNMPLSIARTSSVPPVISTKEESFSFEFFRGKWSKKYCQSGKEDVLKKT